VVDAVVDEANALAIKVGIPERLRDLNVKENSLEKLALSDLNDVCTSGNPRITTFVKILNLYKRAFLKVIIGIDFS